MGLMLALTAGFAAAQTPAPTVAAATPSAPVFALHSLFTDNMVLQREMPVPVNGTAVAGAKVAVSFAGQQKETVAGADGKWSVKLDPLPASATPQTLTVTSPSATAALKIANVVVGDIWVCSGQSNMRKTVADVQDGPREIAAAIYPDIRLFDVPIKASGALETAVTGSWKPCSPATVAGFTAVGYYFGRDLYQAIKVPIGLIYSCKGGTRAENWTPRAALAASPKLAPMLRKYDDEYKTYAADPVKYKKELHDWELGAPAQLYNAMIHPLTSFAIKGALWYQGEANTPKPAQYPLLLSALIKSWRAAWGEGDFPFLIVQLAAYEEPRPDRDWAELRHSQYIVSQTVPHTGLAVTIDIGDKKTIHPLDKQDVGARLALVARQLVYGESDLVASGPVYQSMKIEDGKVRLTFDHVGGGLMAKGGELQTFTIAGGVAAAGKALAASQFVPAQAKIDGNSIVVWSDQVKSPVAVRYAWANFPVNPNLYNKEGLPAVPFGTDIPAVRK